MGIRDRWISLLHRAATGSKKARTFLTPIGVVIFGVFTALFVILAVLIDRLLALPWPVSNVISWLVSVPLMATGLAATVWSVSHFLRVKGTPVPFNPHRRLSRLVPTDFPETRC